MYKFNNGKADGVGALDGHEDDACFAFSYICHYIFGGVAHYVDWYVHRFFSFFLRIIDKPEPGGGAAAGFTEYQGGVIGIGDEYHVIVMVSDDALGYLDR